MAKYYTRKGSKGRKMYFKDGKLITAGQYKAGMRAKARKGKIRVLRTKNSAGNFMHWEVIDGKRRLITAAAYRLRKKKDGSKRKKPTRKVRKNSSKQKKNQSNAAKAMNLYHSGKADSLKEAWAMVKGKKKKTYKKRKNYYFFYSEPEDIRILKLSPAQVEMLFLYHGGQTSMFYSVASQASSKKSGGKAKIRVQDIEQLESELNRAMNMAQSRGDLRTLEAIDKKVQAL